MSVAAPKLYDELMNANCGEEFFPSSDYLFYRYVKKSHFNEGLDWNCDFQKIEMVKEAIKASAFSREIKNGELESYISILLSIKKNRVDRIKDSFEYLSIRRDSFPMTFGFIEINMNDVINILNDENELIKLTIEDEHFCRLDRQSKDNYSSAIHFGMRYISTQDVTEETISMMIIECLRNCLFIINKKKEQKKIEYILFHRDDIIIL